MQRIVFTLIGLVIGCCIGIVGVGVVSAQTASPDSVRVGLEQECSHGVGFSSLNRNVRERGEAGYELVTMAMEGSNWYTCYKRPAR